MCGSWALVVGCFVIVRCLLFVFFLCVCFFSFLRGVVVVLCRVRCTWFVVSCWLLLFVVCCLLFAIAPLSVVRYLCVACRVF